MRTVAPATLPLFRSDLQARLLAVLLAPGVEPLTTTELRERLGASGASLHRELERLTNAGIVESETIGRAKRHRAAPDSPLSAPLRELVLRTMGVEADLARRFAALDGVEAAAIYGSWASGAITPQSDIDLLVVGDVAPADAYEAVREAEVIAGRDIDVRIYGAEELRRRARDGSTFIAEVLSHDLTPLVGDVRAVLT